MDSKTLENWLNHINKLDKLSELDLTNGEKLKLQDMIKELNTFVGRIYKSYLVS